jgi:hypothetical protein
MYRFHHKGVVSIALEGIIRSYVSVINTSFSFNSSEAFPNSATPINIEKIDFAARY